MNKLELIAIGDIKKLSEPDNYVELSLNSPATEFFTDFTETKPLIIESNASAVDTVNLMRKAHVRLKLVLNADGDVVGIVSADDLLERKILQKLQKGDARDELPVTEFMVPTSKLKVLEYSEVQKSNIKSVIEALKNSGQHHCLVIDIQTSKVRGLFSVSEISRRLKVPIDIHSQPSFLKLADHFD